MNQNPTPPMTEGEIDTMREILDDVKSPDPAADDFGPAEKEPRRRTAAELAKHRDRRRRRNKAARKSRKRNR